MQVVEQLIGAEVLAFSMYMVTAEPCKLWAAFSGSCTRKLLWAHLCLNILKFHSVIQKNSRKWHHNRRESATIQSTREISFRNSQFSQVQLTCVRKSFPIGNIDFQDVNILKETIKIQRHWPNPSQELVLKWSCEDSINWSDYMVPQSSH
jgi:hypothetical protein